MCDFLKIYEKTIQVFPISHIFKLIFEAYKK